MTLIKDAIDAMKDVVILTEKVDRVGKVLDSMAAEYKDHEKRLVRLETLVEVAKMQQLSRSTE